MERAKVTAMRVVGDKEGKGDDEKDGVGNEGGVRQRGQWQRLQEQSPRGRWASNGDEGNGDGDSNGKGNDVGDGDGDKADG